MSWASIAKTLDRSLVWSTSALLGHQPLDTEQACALGRLLHLDDESVEALDFELSVERRADPAGDRVRVVLDGKFLPYRVY